MLKIALIGHDPRNDNLGVGALTVSEIELLRGIARRSGLELRMFVLAGSDARPSCISGEDVVERTVRPLRQPWDFLAAIRDCDLAIDISGGDSFADIYGNRRIFQILLQKFLIHLSRRPLIMAPQTVGPLDRKLWRFLAGISVRRCALVATRDDKSVAFLRAMGVKGAVVEASDLALRLPFTTQPRAHGVVKVGLNISGLLMRGGYSGSNMFNLKEDYPGLIRTILQEFLSLPEPPQLHLVGHVVPLDRGGVEDDHQACLELHREFPETVVAPPFRTPSEAKSYIAGLDFFMGARMHACIAAFSSGIPVVPMAYSRKFSGLFGSIGYDRTVDFTTATSGEILEKIMSAYDSRREVAREVEEALRTGRRKLERYELALEKMLLDLQAGSRTQ